MGESSLLPRTFERRDREMFLLEVNSAEVASLIGADPSSESSRETNLGSLTSYPQPPIQSPPPTISPPISSSPCTSPNRTPPLSPSHSPQAHQQEGCQEKKSCELLMEWPENAFKRWWETVSNINSCGSNRRERFDTNFDSQPSGPY